MLKLTENWRSRLAQCGLMASNFKEFCNRPRLRVSAVEPTVVDTVIVGSI